MGSVSRDIGSVVALLLELNVFRCVSLPHPP